MPASRTCWPQVASTWPLAAVTVHGRLDEALERQGLHRRIRLTVPHYVVCGDVLEHSDLVATVPERFAQRVAQPYGLTTRALPLAMQSSAIHQFWHGRSHREPGHQAKGVGGAGLWRRQRQPGTLGGECDGLTQGDANA